MKVKAQRISFHEWTCWKDTGGLGDVCQCLLYSSRSRWSLKNMAHGSGALKDGAQALKTPRAPAPLPFSLHPFPFLSLKGHHKAEQMAIFSVVFFQLVLLRLGVFSLGTMQNLPHGSSVTSAVLHIIPGQIQCPQRAYRMHLVQSASESTVRNSFIPRGP